MVQIKGTRNSEHDCTRPQAGTVLVPFCWGGGQASPFSGGQGFSTGPPPGGAGGPLSAREGQESSFVQEKGNISREPCCQLQSMFAFLQTLSPACLPKVVTLVVATTFMPTPPSAEYRDPSVADLVLLSTLTRHVIQSGTPLSIAPCPIIAYREI